MIIRQSTLCIALTVLACLCTSSCYSTGKISYEGMTYEEISASAERLKAEARDARSEYERIDKDVDRRIDYEERNIRQNDATLRDLKYDRDRFKEEIEYTQHGIKNQKAAIKNQKRNGTNSRIINESKRELRELQDREKYLKQDLRRVKNQIKALNKQNSASKDEIKRLKKQRREAKRAAQDAERRYKDAQRARDRAQR